MVELIYYIISKFRWNSLKKRTLTFNEYLKNNPQCRTKYGIRCVNCNSSSIKNWGFYGATDNRRLFICNHCNTKLYRAENNWIK